MKKRVILLGLVLSATPIQGAARVALAIVTDNGTGVPNVRVDVWGSGRLLGTIIAPQKLAVTGFVRLAEELEG